MTIEVALALLAASIPLTAVVLQFVAKATVTPVQFVRLETEFIGFRSEVRRNLSEIKSTIERHHEP